MSLPGLKMNAAPGGTESEFRAHLAQALREKRDAAVDALRSEVRVEARHARGPRARGPSRSSSARRSRPSSETMSSALSVGGSLLGALFGGRRGSAMRKASTAATQRRAASSKERDDVTHAEADVDGAARSRSQR